MELTPRQYKRLMLAVKAATALVAAVAFVVMALQWTVGLPNECCDPDAPIPTLPPNTDSIGR